MYNFMVEEANKCSQVGSETDVNIFEITLTVYWGLFLAKHLLPLVVGQDYKAENRMNHLTFIIVTVIKIGSSSALSKMT